MRSQKVKQYLETKLVSLEEEAENIRKILTLWETPAEKDHIDILEEVWEDRLKVIRGKFVLDGQTIRKNTLREITEQNYKGGYIPWPESW